MNIKQATTDLEQFRTSLYQNFENRADTLMDLLDAMLMGLRGARPR